MRDVVVSVLLAVRIMFAVAFLSVPFSDTLHGFNVVTVICVVIGLVLMFSVVRRIVIIRRGWPRRPPHRTTRWLNLSNQPALQPPSPGPPTATTAG